MGMLEDVVNQVAAHTGGGDAHARMAAAALQMLASQNSGGLQGLAQTFEAKGLGDMMSAWIGTGPNPPITPDQVHAVLGPEKIQQLAQQAGVSSDLARSLLAAVLPVLVDKLTPNGTLPPPHTLVDEGMGLLKRFL